MAAHCIMPSLDGPFNAVNLQKLLVLATEFLATESTKTTFLMFI
jgi:hypothetical protein